MITSPNVPLNTRSCSPLTARAWRIRKSWRWNSWFAAGFRTSVRLAVASVTTSEARRTGRNSRRTLTPAALKATTSRSLARRAPAGSAPPSPPACRRSEHGDRLACHQPPGKAAHAGVARLCAEGPIRDDQVARLRVPHAGLEPLESLRVHDRAVQIEGQGEVLQVERVQGRRRL